MWGLILNSHLVFFLRLSLPEFAFKRFVSLVKYRLNELQKSTKIHESMLYWEFAASLF